MPAKNGIIYTLIVVLISIVGALVIGYYIGLQEGYNQADEEFRLGMMSGYPDGEAMKSFDMSRDYNQNVSEGGYLVGYMYGYPYNGSTADGIHEHKIIVEFDN